MTRPALATRGPYRKGLERRELLIRTAIEVFAEQGYRGSSLREIASRAEITPAGLLHHFRGKEELLLAVLARREERVAAAIELHRPRSVAEHAAVVIADGEQSACLTRVVAVVSSEASAAGHPLHELFRAQRGRELERIASGVVVDQARGIIDPHLDPGAAAAVVLSAMDGLHVQRSYGVGAGASRAFEDLRRHYLEPPEFAERVAAV
jgi:AcrR family transcriptional regulator